MRRLGICVLALLLCGTPGAVAWAQDHKIAPSVAFLRSVEGQYDAASSASPPLTYAPVAKGRAALPFANLQVIVWQTVRRGQDIDASHAQHVNADRAVTEFDSQFGQQAAQDRYKQGATRVTELAAAINAFKGYSKKFENSSTVEIAETLDQWSRADPLRSDQLGRNATGAAALDTIEAYRTQVDRVIAAVEAKVNRIDTH